MTTTVTDDKGTNLTTTDIADRQYGGMGRLINRLSTVNGTDKNGTAQNYTTEQKVQGYNNISQVKQQILVNTYPDGRQDTITDTTDRTYDQYGGLATGGDPASTTATNVALPQVQAVHQVNAVVIPASTFSAAELKAFLAPVTGLLNMIQTLIPTFSSGSVGTPDDTLTTGELTRVPVHTPAPGAYGPKKFFSLDPTGDPTGASAPQVKTAAATAAAQAIRER